MSTVTILLKLNDLASKPLARVSANAEKSQRSFDKLQDKLKINSRKMGYSIDTLDQKIRHLQARRNTTIIDSKSSIREIRKIEREIGKLEKLQNKISSPKKSGGMGAGIMSGMLKSNLVMRGLDLAASVGSAVFQGTAQKESDIAGLRTFVGDNANKVYSNIEEDAIKSPFDIAGIKSANMALISAGVHYKEARIDAMALANAISATGGGTDELQRMAANMQQIKNVGKATAMDIKQFGMAGINIYQLLADVTGKSTEEVQGMEVSYETLSAALRKAQAEGGIYYGAMEQQNKSLKGIFNSFMESMTKKAADVGDKLSPIFKQVLGFADKLVQNPVFDQFMDDLVSGAGAAFNNVLGILEDLGPVLGVVITGIGKIFKLTGQVINFLSPLIRMIAQFARTVLTPVLEFINKVLVKLEEGLNWLTRIMGIKGSEAGANLVNGMSSKVSNPAIENYYSMIGARHGSAYANGMLAKLNKLADMVNKNGAVFGASSFLMGKKQETSTGMAKLPSFSSGGAAVPKLSGASRPSSAAKDVANSISSGGTRVININIQKLFDDINITAASMKEGSAELERMILETINRALYSATNMQ